MRRCPERITNEGKTARTTAHSRRSPGEAKHNKRPRQRNIVQADVYRGVMRLFLPTARPTMSARCGGRVGGWWAATAAAALAVAATVRCKSCSPRVRVAARVSGIHGGPLAVAVAPPGRGVASAGGPDTIRPASPTRWGAQRAGKTGGRRLSQKETVRGRITPAQAAAGRARCPPRRCLRRMAPGNTRA